MAGINKAIIIGNLGVDPEIRYTQSGKAVCNLRVATAESWTDKDGEKNERTEWHNIVVWGQQAENCEKYLEKGRQVYVEGSLQTRDWEDKDGNKRYTTEIVAKTVQFLSGGGGGGRGGSGGGGGGGDYDSSYSQERPSSGGSSNKRSGGSNNAPNAFDDEDIPF